MIKNSPQSRKPQVFLCLLVLLAWLNRVMWRHSSKGKNVSGKEWAFPFLTSNSQGPCFKRRCPGKTTNSFRLFSLMAQVSWDSAPPNLYLVRRKRCQSTSTGDCMCSPHHSLLGLPGVLLPCWQHLWMEESQGSLGWRQLFQTSASLIVTSKPE